ncbi:MAG: CHY zinc finger protein, partial [Candidatus Acidiferrum sp.]
MPPTTLHVHGLDLDPQTRCLHYRSPLDIIAIKMKCCGLFYACKDCHIALAGHPIEPWPQSEWAEPAVLCGACRSTLSISAYLACNSIC